MYNQQKSRLTSNRKSDGIFRIHPSFSPCIVWNNNSREGIAVKKVLHLWVLGGDLRQVHLAHLLAREGHLVHTYALEGASAPAPQHDLSALSGADGVILPMPVTADGHTLFAPLARAPVPLEQVLALVKPEQFLCGGRLEEGLTARFRQKGCTILDYYEREELILANCVPTAEGAIQIAMERLPITIHGARVLVVGCGRLGQITAQRFAALGARVTVAARRHVHLAWAHCHGFGAEDSRDLAGRLSGYHLIINTVPALLLGAEELGDLRPDCLIIDLASKPGGVDFAAAEELGLTAIHALALPGKVAPATAGAIIKDTICHMLHEHGS